MKTALTILLLLNFTLLPAQSASIKGKLMDSEGSAVIFANVALFSSKDSSLTKVASSDASGSFELQGLPAGNYFLKSNYVGMQDYQNPNIQLTSDQHLDLGILRLETAAINLTEATVTAQRSILEVKPDRLIFNVEGTINSIGSDAISLLRKAPSVTIDNNDNISLLGRSGVLVYLDGKRLPLSGQDLSNYLQNLPAEQIDRIEIITNPGAKYEAQGNAGIIDIRLKKDKNLGTNGSVNTSYIQENIQNQISLETEIIETKNESFGTLGLGQWQGYHRMEFQSYQNNFYLDETNENRHDRKNLNYRIGTDYFYHLSTQSAFYILAFSVMEQVGVKIALTLLLKIHQHLLIVF